MTIDESPGTSRRDLLRGGALGAGALALGAGLATVAAPGSAGAATPHSVETLYDYFLKIDGIDGESTDDKHKGEIDIESYSFHATDPPAPTGSGGGSGKVKLSDLHFTKVVDKASPILFQACASGKHIKTAKLTVQSSGESSAVMTVALTNLLVAGYAQTASAEGRPMETISLNFTKIAISYVTLSAG